MNSLVPDGWNYSEMQTIVKDYKGSIVDGPFGSNLKTSDYVESGVPVLQGKNVTNDRFIWSGVRYITNEKAKELSRSSVRVGEILMVKIGSVGYSAIVDNLNNFDFAIIPANLIKIDIDESKAVTKYVHHYMTSPEGKRRIVDEASSTAQPALSLGTMKKFKLPVPPLPEQKKIASILTAVDEVIENTQKQIDKLQDLKRATMNELLTKGIGHTEFKDSELGRIPKSWGVSSLGSFVLDQKSGASLSPSDFCEDGFGVIPKKGVQYGGRIVLGDKLTFCTNEFADNNRKNIVSNEYVIAVLRDLVPTGPSIGLIGMLMEDAEFVLAQGVYGYLLDSRLNPLFLSLISNTDWYRGIMRKIFVGSTQIHIRSTEFLEVVIPIPPVEEQHDIAERINMMESQILLKQKVKHKFSSLKKSLMQDLLTGRVRVNP